MPEGEKENWPVVNSGIVGDKSFLVALNSSAGPPAGRVLTSILAVLMGLFQHSLVLILIEGKRAVDEGIILPGTRGLRTVPCAFKHC